MNEMPADSRSGPESGSSYATRFAATVSWISVYRLLGLLAVVFSGTAFSAAAGEAPRPDLAREQRMADQIVDAILDGEPLKLRGEGKHDFLAIHTPAGHSPAKGTAIILHGRGFHPDWVDVVQPLRVGLTEHGWHTLSIQMPVLEKEATYNDYWHIFDDAVPRIDAAIAKARQLHPGRVVLIAHSCGAHMALRWMRHKGQSASDAIDAFVGIGMGATDFGQPMRGGFSFDALRVPVLDLYTEHDFTAVHRLAPQRRGKLALGGNAKSAQIIVPDADHYFVDRGDVLIEVLAGWLDTL